MLFILFAEDRKLLPYRVNHLYTNNRSLGRFRDEIASKLDRVQDGRGMDYAPEETGLWSDLQMLFDLIDEGASRYGVPAYNGGLFDPDLHPFLSEKVLPDRYLARVIDQLGRAPDPNHPDAGLFKVDYRDLAIQHLGNVYEGLLELRPHYATEDMIVVRNRSSDRKEEKVVPASAPVESGYEPTEQRYPRGSIYLLTDKGERRATGSYYTPNHIVDCIVDKTLGPICAEIDQRLSEEIEKLEVEHRVARGAHRVELSAQLELLRADFDDRILRLRVLDPSMGSGHFLLRACQFLAEQISTNPNAKDPEASRLYQVSVDPAADPPLVTRRIGQTRRPKKPSGSPGPSRWPSRPTPSVPRWRRPPPPQPPPTSPGASRAQNPTESPSSWRLLLP